MRGRAVSLLLIPALLLDLLLGGCAAGEEALAAPEPEGSQESVSIPTPAMRCLYYERELFLSAMSLSPAYEGEGRLVAGMVPHHLVASDMIAGFFRLAAAQAEEFDTVLIVSPSHFPENCGSDVVTATADWQTPYGTVSTDTALTERLLQNPALGAEDNPAAVELDHGAAGLIPFVRYYLPETEVAVLLLANRLDRGTLAAVWEEIAALCAGGRVLVVASVDCSHYLSPDEAAPRDEQTAGAIEAMDFRQILSFDDANVDSPQALTSFLAAARAGEGALVRLDHSSSAEKLPQALSNPVYEEGITTYFVYAAFADAAEETP